MLRTFNSLLVVSIITVSVLACSKPTTLPTPQSQGDVGTAATRGQLIKNLSVNESISEATGPVCAQLMIPNAGSNKGNQVVEMSIGTCPANGLVDDTTTTVIPAIFSANSATEFDLLVDGVSVGDLGGSASGPVSLDNLCSSDSTTSYASVCTLSPETLISWNP